MKNFSKKVAGVLMVVALAMGVLTVPTQKAQAASKKLTEADFEKCTTANGNFNFINFIQKDKDYTYQEYCGKSTSLKRTKRGIAIDSTRSQVIKKYGKRKVKKTEDVIKNDVYEKSVYQSMLSEDPDFKKDSTKKFIEYKLNKKVKSKNLLLRFYLNDKNKVSVVAFIAWK